MLGKWGERSLALSSRGVGASTSTPPARQPSVRRWPVGTDAVNVLSNPIQVFTDVQIQSVEEKQLTVGSEG